MFKKKGLKSYLPYIGTVLILVVIQFILYPTFHRIENLTFDMRAKLAVDGGMFSKKFTLADKNVAMVTVDDASRNIISKNPQLKIGAWPWRRDVWGEVVSYVEKGNPKGILFDIIFTDIDATKNDDAKFANVLNKHNNVVLATSVNNPKFLVDRYGNKGISNSMFSPSAKPLNVENFDKDIDYNITYYSHSAVHDLYTKHSETGVVNKIVAEDNVIRKSQPIFKLIKDNKEYYLPSLSFAGFLKYVGEGDKIVIKNHVLSYKNYRIPLDEKGQVVVNWHGIGRNYAAVSVADVLLGKVSPSFFKDKVVVIGRTEAGTDIHASSVNPLYAGPEVNTTVIDNFANDGNINNPKARKFVGNMPKIVDFLVVVAFCALIIYVGKSFKNIMIAAFSSLLAVILYNFIATYLFAMPSIRLYMPVVIPMYYMIATFAIVFIARLQEENAKKSEIMNAFGKFVSPSVLKTLMKKKDELVLHTSKKYVTVMFCDVNNFTTLSEKSDPEELVETLNEMFEMIVNIIFQHNGTVDKFIGDCVMAYWGDPIATEYDAYMAVKAGFEIKKALKEWREANPDKLPIDVKFGINTGDALLGLVGSSKLMSYTAMGDVVNTTARLEAACHTYNSLFLISKSTLDASNGHVVADKIGDIKVKGKDIPIEVYEPKELK